MLQIWRAFSNIIPLFIYTIPVVMIWGYIKYRLLKKNGSLTALGSTLVEILLLLSVIGIALVTLTPQKGDNSVHLIPFINSYALVTRAIDVSIPLSILGFNILLFIPFGFFFAWKSGSLRKTITAGCLLSVSVETIQFLAVLGRTAHIDDVLLNTLGTLIGGLIFFVIRYFTAQKA